jgi:RimJ/RimL family protein N-acetyltransferase
VSSWEAPMNVEPVRLEGPTLYLEPLGLEHAADLWRHYNPEIFRHTLDFPEDASFEAFEGWIGRCMAAPASLDFVIRLGRPENRGEPIGCTAYLEIRPPHRGLEIGRTWIAHAWQGTRVNPESKYLLLRHAFESLGALRVQFKTDLNNVPSQRAIEKLGARREGVLRRYQVRTNGLPRDTVIYSVIADDWPAVKTALEGRLAAGS